jgi:hypothetical protein
VSRARGYPLFGCSCAQFPGVSCRLSRLRLVWPVGDLVAGGAWASVGVVLGGGAGW